MVPDRGSGPHRRGGIPLHRGPEERHADLRRGEHLPGGGGGGPLPPSGGGGGGGDRCAPRAGGGPNGGWGEGPMPIVVTSPGQSVAAEELIRFCEAKLARYKIPKAVAFTDVLPRNAAGRAQARAAREQW